MVIWLYNNGYMPIFIEPFLVSPGTASSPRPSPPRVDSVERLRSELDYWRHLTMGDWENGPNRCESPTGPTCFPFCVVEKKYVHSLTMKLAVCRCSLILVVLLRDPNGPSLKGILLPDLSRWTGVACGATHLSGTASLHLEKSGRIDISTDQIFGVRGLMSQLMGV